MNSGEFCWNELTTPNVEAAKDFYGKMFGWKFTDHQMGDTNYTMITKGDDTFGGMRQIPADQKKDIPPHWMGYILVDNVEETLVKAEKLGATIKMPATMAGAEGKLGIIVDPTGAHIALWEALK